MTLAGGKKGFFSLQSQETKLTKSTWGQERIFTGLYTKVTLSSSISPGLFASWSNKNPLLLMQYFRVYNAPSQYIYSPSISLRWAGRNPASLSPKRKLGLKETVSLTLSSRCRARYLLLRRPLCQVPWVTLLSRKVTLQSRITVLPCDSLFSRISKNVSLATFKNIISELCKGPPNPNTLPPKKPYFCPNL